MIIADRWKINVFKKYLDNQIMTGYLNLYIEEYRIYNIEEGENKEMLGQKSMNRIVNSNTIRNLNCTPYFIILKYFISKLAFTNIFKGSI